MSDFSIVTCASRPDIYSKCLLKSINDNRRHHNIEIIPVWNEQNHYSASNALNIGLDVSRSDIVVFAHQDVRLLDRWFDRLRELIDQLPDDWAVLGVAGIALDYDASDIGQWGGALHADTVAVGSVWDADDKLAQPPYWDGTKALTKVHCVDECVLIFNKKIGLRFDPAFTGFHFYGVDLCLQARAAAYGVYCSHLPIIHYGQYSASFTGNNKYWAYLRLLYNKWRLRFPQLLGTHMHWSHENNQPVLTSYISISLDSGDGCNIQLKSMGIGEVRLKTDRRYHLLET